MQKRAVRIAVFLLIAIFAVQLIPSGMDGFFDSIHKTSAAAYIHGHPSENVIFNSENRKPAFKLASSKLQTVLFAECCVRAEAGVRPETGVVFDFRKSIVCRISKYFYGSKYRDSRLLI